MSIPFVGFAEGEAALDWLGMAQAIEAGHRAGRPQVADIILRRGADTLLTRSAWIEGLGVAVKACTIFPGNAARGTSTIAGAVNLMSDADGSLEAVIDFHLVTKWKTAADSLLGALRLARPESREILIVGAGTVARSLIEAYGAGFPGARFTVWNRSPAGAERLAAETGATVAGDLEAAVGAADIVACATMATEPVIHGAWLRPGQHLDLIGAYRPDMREADDDAIRRARVFCDARETVVGHIGELMIPIAAGIIGPDHVVADHYEPDAMVRLSPDEITLFKNGGGAHLDLMVSRHILDAWRGGAA